MRILANIINTESPDTEYPKGRIRNYNGISGDPGTPIIEELYGDVIQFFQKLISAADITENDLPDNETNGYQSIEAVSKGIQSAETMDYDNLMFIELDEITAHATNGQTTVCVVAADDIAVADFDSVKKYRYRQKSFDWLGTAYTFSPTATYCQICQMDEDVIAQIDDNGDLLRCITYGGTGWALTGTPLSIPTNNKGTLAKLDTNKIAYLDEGTKDLKTYSWNGSTFSQVGNALNIPGVLAPIMVGMDTDKIAMQDPGNDELRMYEFDGTDWAQVGNGFALVTSSRGAMGRISKNELVFFQYAQYYIKSYRFDGTDWREVGFNLRSLIGSNGSFCAFPNKIIISIADNSFKSYVRVLNF